MHEKTLAPGFTGWPVRQPDRRAHDASGELYAGRRIRRHHVYGGGEGRLDIVLLRLIREELDFLTIEVRILGVYAAAGFRSAQEVTA